MFWVLKRPAFLRFHTGTSNIEHVCEWEFFFFFSHIFVYVGFVSAFYCRLFTCFRGFYISFCLYYLFFVMFFFVFYCFISCLLPFCFVIKKKTNEMLLNDNSTSVIEKLKDYTIMILIYFHFLIWYLTCMEPLLRNNQIISTLNICSITVTAHAKPLDTDCSWSLSHMHTKL